MRASPSATFLLALFVSGNAAAATPEAEHAAAVDSFRRGTQLVEAGKLQDAVDAFRNALEHEPAGVGARLDLADCYEKVGAPASAWREYAIAEAYARRANDPRQTMARTSAAGLEARLLVVRLVGQASPAMELRIDGDLVAEEVVARGSLAIAPGRHRVELTEPGKRPISQPLAGAAGETRALTLAFEAEVPPAASAPPEPATAPSSSTQKTWGLVLGGVGLVGAGVGAIFGGVALSRKGVLETESHDPSVGSARFYSDRSSADALAGASTAAMIVGGVALAAGIVLVATAPSGSSVGVRLVPSVGGGGAGLAAAGSF